jgi:glycosyltransferase involved in cell wall biosynthesis
MISASILIPAFNCADILPDCIQAVLDQTIDPLEIIVIDDGSTDNTVNVAESFKGNTPIFRGPHK